MTLTYSTIFLVSLIAAMVALFFYKLISDASKAIYRSKKRISRSNDIMGFQNHKVAHTPAATAIPSGHNSHVATWNPAGKHPAVSQAHRERSTSWPHRETKSVTIGNAYKVKRKTVGKKQDEETKGKPWGW